MTIAVDLGRKATKPTIYTGAKHSVEPFSLRYWPYGTTLNQIDTLVHSGTPIVSMPILIITKNFQTVIQSIQIHIIEFTCLNKLPFLNTTCILFPQLHQASNPEIRTCSKHPVTSAHGKTAIYFSTKTQRGVSCFP